MEAITIIRLRHTYPVQDRGRSSYVIIQDLSRLEETRCPRENPTLTRMPETQTNCCRDFKLVLGQLLDRRPPPSPCSIEHPESQHNLGTILSTASSHAQHIRPTHSSDRLIRFIHAQVSCS